MLFFYYCFNAPRIITVQDSAGYGLWTRSDCTPRSDHHQPWPLGCCLLSAAQTAQHADRMSCSRMKDECCRKCPSLCSSGPTTYYYCRRCCYCWPVGLCGLPLRDSHSSQSDLHLTNKYSTWSSHSNWLTCTIPIPPHLTSTLIHPSVFQPLRPVFRPLLPRMLPRSPLLPPW